MSKKNNSVVFLDQLAALPVDEVIIHSLEGGIYVASIVMKQHILRVYESTGQALSRRQLGELRRLLAPANCDKVFLVHNSPYGEMIGSAEPGNSEMRLPLSPLKVAKAAPLPRKSALSAGASPSR